MAQPYLNRLIALVEGPDLDGYNLTCKHFFSGAALFVDKRMCASLTPKGIAFRLPQERCRELFAAGIAEPMRYFENSPVKKEYVLFPDVEKLNQAEINGFFRESIVFASRAATE